MESLTLRISSLTRCFHDYGIRSIMENKKGSSILRRKRLLRRTYSVVMDEDEYFIGFGADVDILVEKLVSDNYRVTSIYGMGGLGKTTLARMVYDHPRIRRHFEGFCWGLHISILGKRDVLQGILIKLASKKRESIEKWRDEELVRELYEILQNRRCLLVLDDIWSSDAWESIKDGFPIKLKGSKVLTTTRNKEVATTVDSFIHKPRLLNIEESWELLRKRAHQEKCGQGTEEFEKIVELGKEMVTHCSGLPLAVVVLGGILSSKHSYSEWVDVRDNIKSYLMKGKSVGQEEGDIQKILALSYDDLPFQLKPCFLYLNKYREDEDIKTETLYQIWIAEGMVSIEDRIGDDETMMDIAERYLGELVERCLVLVEREEVTFVRRFKSFHLHDLMRDMCILKAKEENFFELIDHQIRNDVVRDHYSSYGKASYRLAINLTSNDAKRFMSPSKAVSRRLRSLSVVLRNQGRLSNPVKLKLKFNDFLALRVLLLEGIYPEAEYDDDIGWGDSLCVVVDIRLITSIQKLIHLRYSSLRKSSFFCIPSVRNLKQLQTIDLRDSDIRWISNIIGKLTRLKHLYLPEDFVGNIQLDGLINLEILEGFNNRVCDAKHLPFLANLRSLKARVQEKFEDLREFIHHVSKLTRLHLLSLEINNFAFVSEEKLATLKDVLTLSNLVDLSIIGKISVLPEFEARFCSNLHSLHLCWSEMQGDPMSMLEKLPNLRKLKLGTCSFVGKEMACHATGFPRLRSLSLSSLGNLEKWVIEDGATPNLSHLEIYECLQLQMIPDGIRFLGSLKKMNIVHMPEEFCAKVHVNDDGREGIDFHKVIHVPSIITIPI